MKFQDSSFNGLKVTVGTKSVTHPPTHAPKAICPINFFKVGGIMKTKALISFTVTAQLICVFFAYVESRFSHDAAHNESCPEKPASGETRSSNQVLHKSALTAKSLLQTSNFSFRNKQDSSIYNSRH